MYLFNSSIISGTDTFVAACAMKFSVAFRNPLLNLVEEDGSESSWGEYDALNENFDMDNILIYGIEPIIRGLIVNGDYSKYLTISSSLIEKMTRIIFEARDLGVPPYNAVRSSLGLKPATAFADISSNAMIQEILSSIYPEGPSAVDGCIGAWAEDIDLFRRTGDTFREALLLQFLATRNSDYYWFSNLGEYWNSTMYWNIKQYSLSDMVQQNSNISGYPQNIAHVQNAALAFQKLKNQNYSSTSNAVVPLSTGVYLNWTVTGSSVTFEITTNQLGFFALGLGVGMPASFQDVMLVQWNNSTPFLTDAHSTGYVVSSDSAKSGGVQDLSNFSYALDIYGNNHYVWSRSLTTSDPWDFNITTGMNAIIYAFGTTPLVTYHGPLRGTIWIDFLATDDTTVIDPINGWSIGLKLLHGFFMVSAFNFAVPFGVFIARYVVSPTWIKKHIQVNVFVLSQVTFSVFSAIVGSRLQIFSISHGILGVTTFSVVLAVMLVGMLTALDISIPLKTYRTMKYFHAFTGMIVWALGWWNCFLGVDLLTMTNPEMEWIRWLLLSLDFITIAIFGVAEYRKLYYGKVSFPTPQFFKWHKDKLFFPSDEGQRILPKFSWSEINEKVSRGFLWLVIENTVYVRLILNGIWLD
jgi:hypothetical protein